VLAAGVGPSNEDMDDAGTNGAGRSRPPVRDGGRPGRGVVIVWFVEHEGKWERGRDWCMWRARGRRAFPPTSWRRASTARSLPPGAAFN
jgi:hypothetical protein